MTWVFLLFLFGLESLMERSNLTFIRFYLSAMYAAHIIANKKITWGKFRFGTPKFIVKSYALIVSTLMFALI
jgi:hypothetical protein